MTRYYTTVIFKVGVNKMISVLSVFKKVREIWLLIPDVKDNLRNYQHILSEICKQKKGKSVPCMTRHRCHFIPCPRTVAPEDNR
jgi:hypothetical protein